MRIVENCTKEQVFRALDNGRKAWYATIMGLGHRLKLDESGNQILLAETGKPVPCTRIGSFTCEED